MSIGRVIGGSAPVGSYNTALDRAFQLFTYKLICRTGYGRGRDPRASDPTRLLRLTMDLLQIDRVSFPPLAIYNRRFENRVSKKEP
jgi:hypothetical protein